MSTPASRPYLIGLTGNIACGKSTISALLARHGADVIDADLEVHALYGPGTPVSIAIAAAFGPGVLAADGSVDRRALGAVVFSDPVRLQQLESITHPAVRRRIEARIAGSRAPVVVVEAIKLIEGGLAERCDTVWVVTCPPHLQRARLMARNDLDETEAERRIAAQPSQADKIAHADLVVSNTGDLKDLEEAVMHAWQTQVMPHLTAANPASPGTINDREGAV